MEPRLIAIMGPTGSGKSLLAEKLGSSLDAMLISADAFHVYRGLDIGTNKPASKSRYQLLDIIEPTDGFGLGAWIKLALPLLDQAFERGQNVILVGGTGLYIRALMEEYKELHDLPEPALREKIMRWEAEEGLKGLIKRLNEIDPEALGKLDQVSSLRVRRALEHRLGNQEVIQFQLPPFRKYKFGTVCTAEEFHLQLQQRLDAMLASGWIDEVKGLLSAEVPPDAPGFRAIGYHSIIKHLNGEITSERLRAEIFLLTKQYAKRQRTWLRSEPGLLSIPSPLGRDQNSDQVEMLVSSLTMGELRNG